MIIRPKIATPAELDAYVYPTANNFEIQALGTINEVPSLLGKLQSEMLKTNRTTEFTVHTPPGEVAFEMLFVYAPDHIERIIEAAFCFAPIKVNILFHIYTTAEYFYKVGAYQYLHRLLNRLQGTNVTLLFENTLLNMNQNMDVPSAALTLVEESANSHLKFCLDLCHFQINRDVSGGMHPFPREALNLTSQIHFSARLANDGFRDVRTHGRRHQNALHLISDLKYLEGLGYDLDKVPLVLEINEDDYATRPDLQEEIRLLELIKSGWSNTPASL